MNRRAHAAAILAEWLAGGKHADHLLEKQFSLNENFTEQDRAWLTSIVFGVMERLFALRFALDDLTAKKWRKNKKILQAALMLGAYELLFTSGKEFAIVNEVVSLITKQKQFERKLVNGILRQLARRKAELAAQIAESTDLEIRYNIPQAMHAVLKKEHAESDLLAWYVHLQGERQSLWVRRNALKTEETPLFFRAEKYADVAKAIEAGEASIQNRAAGRVVEYLAPKPQTKILDFCSAPGTKAAFIAELSGDNAEITATDSNEFRLSKVNENSARLGLTSIKTAPLAAVLASGEHYDQVLVDIPCSGLGTLGKRSDLVHHFSHEKLNELETLQRDILQTAKERVAIGGELVLSTCTILERENVALATHFLAENSNFSAAADPLYCLPFTGETDGSFAIKFKRNS